VTSRKLCGLLLALVFAIALMPGRNQAQEQPEPHPEKAAALIHASIAARGGDKYLGVRTLVGRGEYTSFQKGKSTIPQSFVDTIVYPDRERTEFGSGDHKYVQTNVGTTGWVYEGDRRLIEDQKEDQIKLFEQSARYDLDIMLRKGWQERDAKLVYLGRREAWPQTFSEAIRIDFSDGGSETIYFDRQSKLPIMNEFKIITGDGTRSDSVRYYDWLEYDGVKFAHIQDTYRDKLQTARTLYVSVKINVEVPDKIFAKPANIKEVK
jgi:hypothetical protein